MLILLSHIVLCCVLKIRQKIVFGDFLDRTKCIKYSPPMTFPFHGLSPLTVTKKGLFFDGHFSKLFPLFFLAKDS